MDGHIDYWKVIPMCQPAYAVDTKPDDQSKYIFLFIKIFQDFAHN